LAVRPGGSKIVGVELKVTSILSTESKNAVAAAKTINVDNVRMENLRVSSRVSGVVVETRIECTSIGTLLNTLDDVIRCQITSEELMKNG
jgi:hypothetical protein